MLNTSNTLRDKKIVTFSVSVPSNICVDVIQTTGKGYSLSIKHCEVKSFSGVTSFFSSSTEKMTYLLTKGLKEGQGGLIKVSAESTFSEEAIAESRRLSDHLKDLTYKFEASLDLVGSGFRARCYSDPEFQNGACLFLQLGSKNATVRIP